MIRGITRSAVLLAALVFIGAGVGTAATASATAAPAPALGAERYAAVPSSASMAVGTRSAPCTTWQFLVVEHGTIRDAPGGNVIGDAYYPTRVNVQYSSASGGWYWGNFYYVPDSGNRYWYKSGWILTSHLRYTGHCW
jgi:hypothetical protein